jgi:glycosyltransferase involved in cell wall biosynthesis
MDITVSLQFHNEGWLAHPTLRALHRVVRHAEASGKQVEVVATLDRTRDDVLRRIVKQWSARFRAFHSHEVDFGDPALCRNFVVQRARGRCIAPHDGDNLYGEDWLSRAHDLVRDRPRAIAHPELIWVFQGFYAVWVQEPVEQPADLLATNPWDTVCLAAREVFEKVPYRAATHAFAYEDWAWNCDTIGAGFEHVFVPGTIIAKRQKPHEESNEGAWLKSGKTLHRLPLIASILRTPAKTPPTETDEVARDEESATDSDLRRRYKKTKEAFKRRHPATFQRLLGVKQMLVGKTPPPSSVEPVPDWATRELDRLAQLEPAVTDFAQFEWAPRGTSGLAPWITPEMGKLLDAERPAVVLLPWLERGGADLEALHYLHALEGPLFVILTGSGENAWKDKVPAGCTVIDLTVMKVARKRKLALLHRLLLESRPRILHNVNSSEAYELFCAHPASFEGTRKCATVFCADQTEEGSVTGYVVQYLPRLLGFFDRISTDSDSFRKHLIELFGLPEERVVTHRMPFSPPHFPMRRGEPRVRAPRPSTERPLRILFAGRLDRQKRPDLAFEIVRGLIDEGLPVSIDLWGGAHLDPDYFRFPSRAPAGIRMRGSFDGLAALPLEEYDLMLVPSKWEGLPNTLIEAMGNGLPVMAAAVGGVPELVNERTGWPIEAIDDPEAYRRALRAVIADPASVESKSRAALTAVDDARSWKQFVASAREFYGEASAARDPSLARARSG